MKETQTEREAERERESDWFSPLISYIITEVKVETLLSSVIVNLSLIASPREVQNSD